jgi:hypothetical protein
MSLAVLLREKAPFTISYGAVATDSQAPVALSIVPRASCGLAGFDVSTILSFSPLARRV